MGPNGGKTTSFYMIVGLIKPNGGNIFLDQTEITNFPMYKRAQHGIGYLAQEASVFENLVLKIIFFQSFSLLNSVKRNNISKWNP